MIKAVLFDLDETLFARTDSLRLFLADQHRRFFKQLGGVPFELWRDRFLALDERGHTHKSVVYPALLAEFNAVADSADALLADYQTRCAHFAVPFHGAFELLAGLRSRSLALGIVTNGDTEFQARHIRALGLDRLMDAILISEQEGLRKPDAEIFRRAAAKLGVDPAQCLFVGDNPVVDVLGAAAAGMRVAWFRQGQVWPSNQPAPPGATIDHLTDVLSLIEGQSEVLT